MTALCRSGKATLTAPHTNSVVASGEPPASKNALIAAGRHDFAAFRSFACAALTCWNLAMPVSRPASSRGIAQSFEAAAAATHYQALSLKVVVSLASSANVQGSSQPLSPLKLLYRHSAPDSTVKTEPVKCTNLKSVLPIARRGSAQCCMSGWLYTVLLYTCIGSSSSQL
jgi:hypothetical protein